MLRVCMDGYGVVLVFLTPFLPSLLSSLALSLSLLLLFFFFFFPQRTMRCARVKAAPDFRATLSSWRERLPNSWEPPEAWEDVLGWRRAIFRRMLSGLG